MDSIPSSSYSEQTWQAIETTEATAVQPLNVVKEDLDTVPYPDSDETILYWSKPASKLRKVKSKSKGNRTSVPKYGHPQKGLSAPNPQPTLQVSTFK